MTFHDDRKKMYMIIRHSFSLLNLFFWWLLCTEIIWNHRSRFISCFTRLCWRSLNASLIDACEVEVHMHRPGNHWETHLSSISDSTAPTLNYLIRHAVYVVIVAGAAGVWDKSRGNLIKVGIMRQCWRLGVMLSFLTAAYCFTAVVLHTSKKYLHQWRLWL